MAKKSCIFIFFLALFFFAACESKKAEKLFNEAESYLDDYFGEGGAYVNIQTNIVLPGNYGEVAFTWSVDKPEAIALDGKVTRTYEDQEVILTCMMEYREKTREVKYRVTVKGLERLERIIYFDSQGGSEVPNITAKAGDSISKPEDPEREGYRFLGWFILGSDEEFVFEEMPDMDLALRAKWEKILYTISFESAGGSPVDAIRAGLNDDISSPENPVREDYRFLGWYEEGSDKEFIFYKMPARDITLYARWEEIIYHTISFESEGGSEVESITAEVGSTILRPVDPECAGYSFIGWFEEGSDEEFVFHQMPERDVVLYARWELCTEGLEFVPNFPFYEVAGYSGTATEVHIPSKYMGYTVTGIRHFAFGNSAITSVSIPATVNKIDSLAFKNCKSLESIHIPASVENIGVEVFEGCDKLFIYVEAPAEPEGWEEDWHGGRPRYFGVDEVKEEAGIYYLVQEGAATVTRYAGSAEILDLSAGVGGLPIAKIGERSFENSALKKIVLPEAGEIAAYAFANSEQLAEVILPRNLTVLEKYVFSGCKSLREIALPEGLKSIEKYAFYSCESLESIAFPESLEAIAAYAFSRCFGLIEVVFPKNLASLGQEAFYKAGLLRAYIPASVTTIGDSVFGPSPTYIYAETPEKPEGWDEEWRYLGGFVFYGVTAAGVHADLEYCVAEGKAVVTRYLGNETAIEIPSLIDGHQVAKIMDNAFKDSENLESILLPAGLEEIGKYAFFGGQKLTRVFIPESVAIIGIYAFSDCPKLVVYAQADTRPAGWGQYTLTGGPMYFGVEEVFEEEGIQYILTEQGATITNYVGNANELTVPSLLGGLQVTKIGSCAFRGSLLKSVVLPNNLEKINNSAFQDCASLLSIVIPEGVTEISANAFSGCTSLESVVLPNNLEKINSSAFQDCAALLSIVISEGVTEIRANAFSGCTSLESVTLHENLITIWEQAFNGCENLATIVIPESVIKMGTAVFGGCSNLTIYAQVSEKPGGWAEDWNPMDRPVHWGYGIE